MEGEAPRDERFSVLYTNQCSLDACIQPVPLPGSQPVYPEGNRSYIDKVSAARPTVDSAVILREGKGEGDEEGLGRLL